MNFGTALAGYGQAAPQLQKMQQEQQKRQLLQQLFAGQQQQGGGPAGLPGSTPLPGGAAPGGMPGAGGAQPAGPQDMGSFINKVMASPGDPLAKMDVIQELMPVYVEQRRAYHETELDKYNKARTEWYEGKLDDDKIKTNKARDWNDPAQRPQIKPAAAKDTLDDKDMEKGLDDAVAIQKQEVFNAGNDVKKHDAAMAKYNDAVAARSSYHKNKSKNTADAPAMGTDVPVVEQLSPTEERSLDGGKTWWYLKDGKPAQAGQ